VSDCDPILVVSDLRVYFSVYQQGSMPWSAPGILKAVDGVSFELAVGETLGIVGESGCGKSTLARALIRMLPAKSGRVLWLGQDILGLTKSEFRVHRKQIQMIFQDPLASLNPRMTVGQIISEPLRVHFPDISQSEMRHSVLTVMEKVGLLPNFINRYPHEFSGGQCQRIAIARAVVHNPKILILDEATSSLDTQSERLVQDAIDRVIQDTTAIVVAHRLSTVMHADKIIVFENGKVLDQGKHEELFDRLPLYKNLCELQFNLDLGPDKKSSLANDSE